MTNYKHSSQLERELCGPVLDLYACFYDNLGKPLDLQGHTEERNELAEGLAADIQSLLLSIDRAKANEEDIIEAALGAEGVRMLKDANFTLKVTAEDKVIEGVTIAADEIAFKQCLKLLKQKRAK